MDWKSKRQLWAPLFQPSASLFRHNIVEKPASFTHFPVEYLLGSLESEHNQSDAGLAGWLRPSVSLCEPLVRSALHSSQGEPL